MNSATDLQIFAYLLIIVGVVVHITNHKTMLGQLYFTYLSPFVLGCLLGNSIHWGFVALLVAQIAAYFRW